MKISFDHEKLDVYQEAIAFCGWVGEFLTAISAKAAAKDQLDRASTSIPLNIAEGNGKFSAKDRARFFEMARAAPRWNARHVLMFIGAKTCQRATGRRTKGKARENCADAHRITSQVL